MTTPIHEACALNSCKRSVCNTEWCPFHYSRHWLVVWFGNLQGHEPWPAPLRTQTLSYETLLLNLGQTTFCFAEVNYILYAVISAVDLQTLILFNETYLRKAFESITVTRTKTLTRITAWKLLKPWVNTWLVGLCRLRAISVTGDIMGWASVLRLARHVACTHLTIALFFFNHQKRRAVDAAGMGYDIFW